MSETLKVAEEVLESVSNGAGVPLVPVTDRSHFYSRTQRSPANKPMLARVAETLYWMSRYMERAEHIARIVSVNSHVLMDLGELDPTMHEKQWQGVLRILRLENDEAGLEALSVGGRMIGQRVSELMTLDQRNRNSLISCLTSARENARSIRENISVEMWETLNTLYWSVRSDEAKYRFQDTPQEIYLSVIAGSLLFQGVTDQTLPHGQAWQFVQVAKYLERADMICRIIDTKFDILRASESMMETPLYNIQWMAVLRTCCSIEAYRRRYVGELDPTRLADFLILDDESPRTVRYSVKEAQRAIAGIAAKIHPLELDDAERILGRLHAQLEYAEPSRVAPDSLKEFLASIRDHLAGAASAIQQSYFLH